MKLWTPDRVRHHRDGSNPSLVWIVKLSRPPTPPIRRLTTPYRGSSYFEMKGIHRRPGACSKAPWTCSYPWSHRGVSAWGPAYRGGRGGPAALLETSYCYNLPIVVKPGR